MSDLPTTGWICVDSIAVVLQTFNKNTRVASVGGEGAIFQTERIHYIHCSPFLFLSFEREVEIKLVVNLPNTKNYYYD